MQQRRQRQSGSQQDTQDHGSTPRATATAHVVLQQASIKNGYKQVRLANHWLISFS